MNEAIQFDNRTQLERSRKLGNFFKPLVICCRFHKILFGAQKKENKNFKEGERGLYLSLEVGVKVETPNGIGIIESIIEDIHCSMNVRMEDGTLKNFMHPATEFVNGKLEFVWKLKNYNGK